MAEETKDINNKGGEEVALGEKKCLRGIIEHEAVDGRHKLKQVLTYYRGHGLVDLREQDHHFVGDVQHGSDEGGAHDEVDDQGSLVVDADVVGVVSAPPNFVS